MAFIRNWDSSCPRIYDQWEQETKRWVIQDLPPEDDEAALSILREYMCPDEVLCSLSGVIDDPESMKGILDFWRESLLQRASLACYVEVGGIKKLVALNVCVVDSTEHRVPEIEIRGEAWKNVFRGLEYLEAKCDPFKYLDLDVLLHALGLVVSRDYRGDGLGSRILSAREPLCKVLGVKATATVFTGPASQKSAARAGFETICKVSLKELAESGLKYPPDENRFIKLMVKRFD